MNPTQPHPSIPPITHGNAERLIQVTPISLFDRIASRLPVLWLRLLGLLLIAAALSKLLAAITDVFIDLGLIDRLQISAEIVGGIWIMATPRLALARWVGVGVYALFAAAAAYLMLTDWDSCGCFGRWSPPPWAMLVIDCVAITGLAVLKPTQNHYTT